LRFNPYRDWAKRAVKPLLWRDYLVQRAAAATELHFVRFLETEKAPEGAFMTHIDIVMIQPLVALIFGILILILPRLLNYLIAIYLILIGLTGLFPHIFTATTST
jgi:hypothetical protein